VTEQKLDLLQSLSPGFSNLEYATEQSARPNVRSLEPLVQDILHPCWHRDGADMPRLSLPIDDGPLFLTPLNMAEVCLNLPGMQLTLPTD
jgi:hypothetical protein